MIGPIKKGTTTFITQRKTMVNHDAINNSVRDNTYQLAKATAMKILLLSINHFPEQTSTGKYQGEMAKWLVEHGHDVHVVTAPPYYPAWKVSEGYNGCCYSTEEIDGAKVFRVPLYVPAVPTGVKRVLHLASFALMSLPVLIWQAFSWKPDVVLATAPPMMAAPCALLAGAIAGAKTHLRVQDFEVDAAFDLGLLNKSPLQRFALFVERLILQSFDAVNTISPRMRDKLIEKGVKKENTHLVPNWAGVDDFDPAQGAGPWKETLKSDPKTVLAVYSGNLGRKQGLDTIIDAATLLKNQKHIHFIISGDGAVRKEIEEKAKDMDNITMLPIQPMKEFIHLMIAADIHLLPQRAEAADLVMPSKLGNILASGRPVVVGAMPETQLYDAVQCCGAAVPPDDSKAFADAITDLAKDADLRAQIGKECQARAHKDWSQDSIMEKLGTIINS